MFEISQLAQVAAERYEQDNVNILRRLNKAVKLAVDNPIGLRIPRLDLDSIQLVGFSDASFAINHDLSTQLEYIVFIVDNQGNSGATTFKYYKSKRIVRSAMADEFIAVSDMFDTASATVSEIEDLYGRHIPLQLFTYSKSLFDVISKGSLSSEKRLMLDVVAARAVFRDRLISDIGFVRRDRNLADGLTKGIFQVSVQHAIATATLHTHPEKWHHFGFLISHQKSCF